VPALSYAEVPALSYAEVPALSYAEVRKKACADPAIQPAIRTGFLDIP